MKRATTCLFIALCLLALSGCAHAAVPIETQNVAGLEITHHLCGQEEELLTIENRREIARLVDWMDSLSLAALPPDQCPGGAEGGETYTFTLLYGDETAVLQEFSYVVQGPSACYLLSGGQWYQVLDPANPF
ncbi:MAG: hypothetical protein ACOX83_11720 [Candidatus Spyradocola sp.]|jgi:hypothetical protein